MSFTVHSEAIIEFTKLGFDVGTGGNKKKSLIRIVTPSITWPALVANTVNSVSAGAFGTAGVRVGDLVLAVAAQSGTLTTTSGVLITGLVTANDTIIISIVSLTAFTPTASLATIIVMIDV